MAAKDLSDFALALIVLGLVTAIGGTVLFQAKIGTVSNLPTYSVNNETLTPVQAGNQTSQVWVKSYDIFTNATNGATIPSGNFTTTIDPNLGTGTVANATANFGAQKVNVSYTVYNTSNIRYDIYNDAENGLGEYGNWFKLLAIVGVAGLLLYLVFQIFEEKLGGSSGSGSY